MKKIFLILFAFVCANVFAQNDKEDMSKYMTGAIPLEDGKVVFSKDIDAPGLSSEQVYDLAYHWLELYLKEHKMDRKDPDTKIFEEKDKGEIAAMPEHHLVFKKTILSVDRSFITYRIKFTASDQHLKVRIWTITYEYYVPDKKEPERYTAENAITDEYALDNTQTKLNQITSKFRIKTIDMVDDIYASLQKVVNAEVTKIANIVSKTEEKAKVTTATSVVATQKEVISTPQPSLAQTQQALAAKKGANTTSVVVPAATLTPAKAVVPNVETPKKEAVKPMQTAPVSSNGYTMVDVKNIPFNVIKVMDDGGMAVSSAGEAAVALWGGMASLNGKSVAICFVKSSQPAFSILEKNDSYSLTFGFEGKTIVLLCKKISSESISFSDTNFSSSEAPKMFLGEIVSAKVK